LIKPEKPSLLNSQFPTQLLMWKAIRQ